MSSRASVTFCCVKGVCLWSNPNLEGLVHVDPGDLMDHLQASTMTNTYFLGVLCQKCSFQATILVHKDCKVLVSGSYKVA